jgi:predicted neuraminidase
MFVRTTNRIGKIAIADSKDNGITWSELRPIDLPNPNSGIDAVALKDGRIVLIYNHTAKGRTRLNLAASADGDRWNMFQALESESGEYSHPAINEAQDGTFTSCTPGTGNKSSTRKSR